MTNINTNFTFTVNAQATVSIHDDGIVILDVGSGCMYTGNMTGGRIWRGVQQGLPLDAIAEEISNEYQIGQTTACEHVASFLAELERHSLIEREESR